MAHNLESMFYAGRTVPWHNLGTQVDEAPSSKEALRLSGLDWTVKPTPVFAKDENLDILCPDWFANIRSSDNSVLGMTTGRYKIVQNAEAFEFTDALLGEGVKYETAGSLAGGRRVWLLARLPEFELVGDKAECFLVFTNSHDGKSSIRVAITPVRVVCQNTLNLALAGAKRNWAAKHTGDMQSKLAEAHRTLELAGTYVKALQSESESLAKTPFYESQFKELADFLFPMPDDPDTSQRIIDNVNANRAGIMQYYVRKDLNQWRDTKFGAVNAVSDFVTHNAPQRQTASFKENLWASVIDGNAMIDKAYEFVRKAA